MRKVVFLTDLPQDTPMTDPAAVITNEDGSTAILNKTEFAKLLRGEGGYNNPRGRRQRFRKDAGGYDEDEITVD